MYFRVGRASYAPICMRMLKHQLDVNIQDTGLQHPPAWPLQRPVRRHELTWLAVLECLCKAGQQPFELTLLHNRRVKQHRTATELVGQAVKEGISLPGSEKLPICRKLALA